MIVGLKVEQLTMKQCLLAAVIYRERCRERTEKERQERGLGKHKSEELCGTARTVIFGCTLFQRIGFTGTGIGSAANNSAL
jgi:hypothetical protein